MTARTCVTCDKACYPTERIIVSDLWIHKQGCLKCSECFSTLSLSSVYIAPSPLPPFHRLLFCAKDVPKVVHTSVVDSISLRAAMNAPNPTTTPQSQLHTKVGKDVKRSMRFKGLTLRSKALRAGLNAPKLGTKGLMSSNVIVGHGWGKPLDSWDIMHALNVQKHVSSPIRDHPALHAQHTGSSAYQWQLPSRPKMPQLTVQTESSSISERPAKAGRDDMEMKVKPNLVKNLIRVFQLDTVDKIEVSVPAPISSPETPDECLSAPVDGASPLVNYFAPVKTGRPPIEGTSTLFQTFKTVATLGTRQGIIATGQSKSNTLKRPALSEIFANASEFPSLAKKGHETLRTGQTKGVDMAKAMKLLEALLPVAAHLIPLPDEGVEDEDLDEAREGLVRELHEEGLEIVMLFEEDPVPVEAV